MQLDQIEHVRAEPPEAPLDAREQRGRPPVGVSVAPSVPALGEEIELPAPAADRFADELLAVLVAFGGVDHVEAGVQRAAEQPCHRAAAHSLIADLGAAETQHAHLHVGIAEPSPFHTLSFLEFLRCEFPTRARSATK